MDERISYLGPNTHVCTASVFLNVVCYKIPNNALTPQNLQKTEKYEIETMLEFEWRSGFAVSFHSNGFVGRIGNSKLVIGVSASVQGFLS